MSNGVWMVPAILLAFLVTFPLLWCAIVGILSIFGGWQRLAQRFRADTNTVVMPAETTWRWQSGAVGRANYNHVLNLTPTSTGLHMQPMWMFRFAHPPLFIPWHAMHSAEERHFLVPQVRVEVGSPTITTLRLPAAIFAEQNSLPM